MRLSDIGGKLSEGYRVVPGFDREKYQERQGLEGPFHTKSGKVVYYDKVEGKYYDPDTDMYIEYDDWQAMNEAGEDTFMSALKGLKTWQVVIMNNYYRGKYSDYSGRYYYVLASSPEEARQVVLDNADAILQDLLSMKSVNGKKILPRSSAIAITDKRIGDIKDGTEAGRMTTAGFKRMFGPQGPMMVKLSGGAVVDVQGQEQGVAEGSLDLKDPQDYMSRKKAIQDLQMDPATAKNPTLKTDVMRRKAELEKAARAKGFVKEDEVDEGYLSNPGQEDSPVAQAITRRILLQRTDLLAKYGPEKVGAAIDEVADFVGDVDEIGSSDVSGWVRQVETNLKDTAVGESEEQAPKSALGKALWRDLSKFKKASPAQQQRNKERWAQRQAEREQGVAEGAKVDRMVKHIAKSEREAGKSAEEAEDIAWATANKRGYLDNKNKKAK